MRAGVSHLGRWGALVLVFTVMGFSYQYGANPAIDYPRLLVADTVPVNHIFEDEEITAAGRISSGVWQSAQLYSGTQGVATMPTPPTSYLRTAALLLDSLAANKSRFSSVRKLLDVELSPGLSAQHLRDQAERYRQIEDESGAFVIIEQVQTEDAFSYRDRFWKCVQRNSGA